MTVVLLTKALHIIGAAMWFAIPLTLAGDIKRTLERDREHAKWLCDRTERSLKLVLIAGLLTLATGFALIFLNGGFGAVHSGIHTGLLLTLALFVLGVFGLRPTWKSIAQVINSERDLKEARAYAKRFAMLTGIAHLIWLVVLLAMVLR